MSDHRSKKRAAKKRPNVETIQVQFSGTSARSEAVPNTNVLDLRSEIAKKEVRSKRETRQQQRERRQQRKAALKMATAGAKRNGREKQRAEQTVQYGEPRVLNEAEQHEVALPQFSIANTRRQRRKQQKHKDEPKGAAVQKKDALQELRTSGAWRHAAPNRRGTDKKRAGNTPATSFWKRPLEDREMNTVDRKKLPALGFSISSVLKPAAGFALFAMVLVLPASVSAMLSRTQSLETIVVQSSEDAFLHLQAAGEQLQGFNFTSAEQEFTNALKDFTVAEQEVLEINAFLVSAAKYIPGKGQEIYTGRNLLTAGEELAAAGEQLSKALRVLSEADLPEIAQDEEQGLTAILAVAHSALSSSVGHIHAASDALDEVSLAAVPEDKRSIVIQAQTSLPTLEVAMEDALQLSELLFSLLGHDKEKQYLVLFQNNYEMRPTGGFLGSLAVVDISNGVVTGMDIPGGGVYDISGQFEEKLISPEPLHLINPHWNLQDANWFPHFPSSARKIQWFYEESGGQQVDGVITLVPSVIERMLEVTGPIDMTEDYGTVITAENFYDEVQVRAEEKYDVTRESKKILADMTPKLFNKLFASAEDPQSLMTLFTVMRTALEEKDILIEMNDVVAQQGLTERDWSGELKQTDRDYLAVIHANIGGGKTDAEIEEVVKHRAEIQADGSVVDTVTVTRVHKGSSDSEFANMKNIDYVRLYVPEGSTLLSVSGFNTPDDALFLTPDKDAEQDEDLVRISGEIYQDEMNEVWTNTEFGKTVFGGWMQTEAGASSTVELRYKLPFVIAVGSLWKNSDRYSLLVQKQPGSPGSFLVSEVVVPETMQAIRFYPADYQGSAQVLLTQDYFAGMVLEQSR